MSLQMTWVDILKNLNIHQKTLLDLINKFSKVSSYKINIKQSVLLLYANNELSEEKIKSVIYDSIENIKIFRNSLNQEKERSVHWKLWDHEERNWRHEQMERYPMILDWKNYVVQCSYYPKWFKDFNGIFHRSRKKNPKICME